MKIPPIRSDWKKICSRLFELSTLRASTTVVREQKYAYFIKRRLRERYRDEFNKLSSSVENEYNRRTCDRLLMKHDVELRSKPTDFTPRNELVLMKNYFTQSYMYEKGVDLLKTYQFVILRPKILLTITNSVLERYYNEKRRIKAKSFRRKLEEMYVGDLNYINPSDLEIIDGSKGNFIEWRCFEKPSIRSIQVDDDENRRFIAPFRLIVSTIFIEDRLADCRNKGKVESPGKLSAQKISNPIPSKAFTSKKALTEEFQAIKTYKQAKGGLNCAVYKRNSFTKPLVLSETYKSKLKAKTKPKLLIQTGNTKVKTPKPKNVHKSPTYLSSALFILESRTKKHPIKPNLEPKTQLQFRIRVDETQKAIKHQTITEPRLILTSKIKGCDKIFFKDAKAKKLTPMLGIRVLKQNISSTTPLGQKVANLLRSTGQYKSHLTPTNKLVPNIRANLPPKYPTFFRKDKTRILSPYKEKPSDDYLRENS